MQKRGLLGQDLAAGMKRRVKDMGWFLFLFFCLFTYIYEISEMVTLVGIFILGDGQDKVTKLSLLICYVCVKIYSLWIQLMQQEQSLSG